MPSSNRLLVLLALTIVITTGSRASDPTPSPEPAGWITLFDGRTLDGWVAHRGQRGDEKSQDIGEIFTINEGTLQVYRGAPHRSKQFNANLRTKESFSHFHLQVEYRWLEHRFQPRHAAVRDAGILFHLHTQPDAVWPPSIEMQLGGGEPGAPYVSGDLWVIGNTRATSPSTDQSYAPDGVATVFGEKEADDDDRRRANYTSVAATRPHGEWNLAEVIVHGADRAMFYLNGVLVNEVRDLRYRDEAGNWQPLESGPISLQAEWAELQYRAIRIKRL